MPDYGFGFIIFGVSVVVAILLLRLADKALTKSGRKEHGFIRHGGLQASFGLVAAAIAIMSLVFGFAEL